MIKVSIVIVKLRSTPYRLRDKLLQAVQQYPAVYLIPAARQLPDSLQEDNNCYAR